MKNALRLPICVLLVLSLLLPVPVSAQAGTPEDLEQAIIDSCIYGRRIDISEYDLAEQTLKILFDTLKNSGRLPWYTTRTYHYSYEENTGKAVAFEPESLDEIAYDRALYEQKVAEVLDVCIYDGMNQLEIALSIHDYLVHNTVYDTTEARNSGYDLLVNGTTMCSGYAEAYQDLLLRAGVPCLYIASDAMDHAWNLVSIDDQWYHVDVTWDDPTPDIYGHVSHEYFLLTDEEIAAMEDPHHGWETDITCTDTRFSDAFWRGVESQICFSDSETSYLIREKDFKNYVYARNWRTGGETAIYTEKMPYVNIGPGDYSYIRTGLSLWGGRLWLCSLNKVLSMAPDGTDLRTEYRYDTKQNRRFLAGCFVTGDTAYLSASDHDGNMVPHTVELASTGYHTHSYTETVQAPTCLEPGFTVSVCDCGLTCQSDVVAATGHSYEQTDRKEATVFSEGFWTETCTGCGDVVTHQLPKTSPVLLLLASIPVIGPIIAGIVGILCVLSLKTKKKTKV